MSEPVMLHNPRCSKSRATLQLLEENGATPRIIRYLEGELDRATLERMLDALALSPRDLLRRNEIEYSEHGFADATLDRDALIERMLRHPRVIERPVVLLGDRAVIGRPPENVLALLQ